MSVPAEPRDPLEVFFHQSGVPPLPWDVHHTLLWAVHPKAEPHREYVLDAFAAGKMSADQEQAVLAFLDAQARGCLVRHNRDQAGRLAQFGKSLASVAGWREDELAFAALAARARWSEPGARTTPGPR